MSCCPPLFLKSFFIYLHHQTLVSLMYIDASRCDCWCSKTEHSKKNIEQCTCKYCRQMTKVVVIHHHSSQNLPKLNWSESAIFNAWLMIGCVGAVDNINQLSPWHFRQQTLYALAHWKFFPLHWSINNLHMICTLLAELYKDVVKAHPVLVHLFSELQPDIDRFVEQVQSIFYILQHSTLILPVSRRGE